MSNAINTNAKRPDFDKVIVDIANYVMDYKITSNDALETARYCLMDTIGCGMLALQYPACTKMLGPIVEGAEMVGGTPVPGTSYTLDPVQAALNIGIMIRWLDFNDTWLAAEWGHPSDNLGAVLAVADYMSRQNVKNGKAPLSVLSVLEGMIKAHEIQGVIALENSFNRVGLDHVMLVRIASTAVAAQLLGGTREEVINAVSHAWIDGSALRTYRHAPNTGSRKSWAAGDATSRGVKLALIALKGEMGYPSALTVKTWGFQDVLFKGESISLKQPYESYVMENILFKISYPAEFHAQTAVEASIILHPQIKDRLDDIAEIQLETQQAGVRIIDKTGPLDNPADRDHCLQYMVAVGLLKGSLEAYDYEDVIAKDPRLDKLREKMTVVENKKYSVDYLDPEKRSIANAIKIIFKDGSETDRVEVEYPIGHKRRRAEGIPVLIEKFKHSMATRLSAKQCKSLFDICASQSALEKTSVIDFMELLRLP